MTLIISVISPPGVMEDGFGETATVNKGNGFTVILVWFVALRYPVMLARAWITMMEVEVTIGAVKFA